MESNSTNQIEHVMDTKEPKINMFSSQMLNDDNSEKYLSYYNTIVNQIDEIEKKEDTPKHLLKNYLQLEHKCLESLSKVTNNKMYKEVLKETLFEQFFKTNTSKRIKIAKKINHNFNKYLSSIDMKRDLQKDFKINFDANASNTQLKKILKQMENAMYDECISYIMSKDNYEQIPSFLINKSLVKQKVDMIWKMNYSIPVNKIKIESIFGYRFLNEHFLEFIDHKTSLFDENIFNENTFNLIFQSFFLSNLDYISSKHLIYETFINNLPSYCFALHLHYESLEGKVKSKIEDYKLNGIKSYLYNNEIKQIFDELKEQISNEFRILIKETGCEKILKIIFAFSMILNNLVKIDLPKKSIELNTNIKCSACERQFLYNYLYCLDSYIIQNEDDKEYNSTFYINFIIENILVTNILKSFSNSLFDTSMKYKITLTEGEIRMKVAEKESLDTLPKKEEKNINSFNMIDDKMIYTMFSTFLRDFDEKTKSYFNFFGTENDLNISLIPHDPLKISTHITIVVNDFFDLTILNQLNNENKIIDYYYYNWNNLHNVKSYNVFKKMFNFFYNMSNTKYHQNESIELAGKYLAFIIASRAIFKFHTISFIGIGKGCNIIKHCILQLSDIYLTAKNCNDIISNVLFINAQCSIERDEYEKFDISIAGKIYNIFALNDKVKDSHRNYMAYNEVKNDKFENYDVTYLHLEYNDYKYNLCNLINKVKFK